MKYIIWLFLFLIGQDLIINTAYAQGEGPGKPLTLHKLTFFTTKGAHGWDYFEIGDRKFLVAAEGSDLNREKQPNAVVFEWIKNRFKHFQTLSALHGRNAVHVNVKGHHFIIVAGAKTGANSTSVLYVWDEKKFLVYQIFTTPGITNVKFFDIAGRSYMVLAIQNNSYSEIYQWQDNHFHLLQLIKAASPTDFELMFIRGKYYLAVANANNDSEIYRWEHKKFVAMQKIATKHPLDLESFVLKGHYYLAVANQNSQSIIYQWGGHQFNPYQVINALGGSYWHYFERGDKTFLAFASGSNQGQPKLMIYQAQQNKFLPVQDIAINSDIAQSIYFKMDGNEFLLLSPFVGSSELYAIDKK